MKEIRLYGIISNEGFLGAGENGYIERIANEIKAVGNEDINLRINTRGGSVFDGFAIITNLLEHPGKVNMQVDGSALSMGGTILAYANNAIAYDFAKIMLHKVHTYSDNPDDLKQVDSMNQEFAGLFKAKGVDADLMDEIFLGEGNKDYWFTAQGAKDIGLIDEVLNSNQEQKLAASNTDIMSKYYELINQKREVIMFDKEEKKSLQELKDQVQELIELKADVPTMEKVTNLVKEEMDKIAEDVNQANQDKADETATLNQDSEDKISETLQNISGNIDSLADTVKEQSERIAALDKKIENTIAAIKEVATDFVVPEAVLGPEITDVPQSKIVADKRLSDEINKFNEERK